MNRAALLAMLERDEGLRLDLYDDATGKQLRRGDVLQGHPTIGIGRALDVNPLTRAEAEYLCENDIARVEMLLDRNMPWWRTDLSDARQMVVVSMAYNLGYNKFSQFLKFRAALGRGDWEDAAAEMLASAWAGQVGDRAKRLAKLMVDG